MKNREIKYRGISLLTGKMVYGQLLKNLWTNNSDGSGIVQILNTDNIHDFDCWEDLEDGLIEVIPESVGEYTGLKDKNGKEIYEGDIILFQDSDIHAEEIFTNKGVVEFADWGFCITNRNEVDMSDIDSMECEVIGNLFETPELLK